jgi:hypothetical protein
MIEHVFVGDHGVRPTGCVWTRFNISGTRAMARNGGHQPSKLVVCAMPRRIAHCHVTEDLSASKEIQHNRQDQADQ